MVDDAQLTNKDKSFPEMSFPSRQVIYWAEDNTANTLTSRSFDATLLPGYVMKTALRNLQYEERLPEYSEKIANICKRVLLSGSQTLLDDNTVDLANFMFRHLESDLHNMAAHRFFARKTFPTYLKLRGIYILKNEQRSMLLKSMFNNAPQTKKTTGLGLHQKEVLVARSRQQVDTTEVLRKLRAFENSLTQGKELSTTSYSPILKGIIAHMPISVSLMEKLSTDSNVVVQRCLAYNPLTDSSVLNELWKNNDETTMLNIVSNKNTSFDTLQEIAISLPKSLAAKIILSLVEDLTVFNNLFDEHVNSENRSWNVLRGVAGNHHISYDQVVSLMESDAITDLELVYNFLANPMIDSVWKELLKGLIGDRLFIRV